MNLIEMQGFLSGKCLPGDIRVGETAAAYLVRKLEEKDKKIAEQADDIEYIRHRVKEMGLLCGQLLVSMKAAVIEMEHGKGCEQAMTFIYNRLWGPGELPEDEEKDADAFFNREATLIMKELDEVYDWFHARRKQQEGVTPVPAKQGGEHGA